MAYRSDPRLGHVPLLSRLPSLAALARSRHARLILPATSRLSMAEALNSQAKRFLKLGVTKHVSQQPFPAWASDKLLSMPLGGQSFPSQTQASNADPPCHAVA